MEALSIFLHSDRIRRDSGFSSWGWTSWCVGGPRISAKALYGSIVLMDRSDGDPTLSDFGPVTRFSCTSQVIYACMHGFTLEVLMLIEHNDFPHNL